jgi:FkbM family methyltransferase
VLLFGEADDASVIGSIGSRQGDYEPELLAVLSALVARDSVCLDVGANVGPVALALSGLCPDGHVHAFEPAQRSFDFLERNLAANGVANATAHRLALSNVSGQATLSYNRSFTGGAFISDRLHDGVQETVAMTSLDLWAQADGLHRLDLIKVDVEGHEERVLRGAWATIARWRPTLVVELNPVTLRRMQGRHPRTLFTLLRTVYGRAGHVAVVADSGHMVPVCSWGQLRRQLTQSAICNLVCSPSRLMPGHHPGVAGPRELASVLAGGLWRGGRFGTPPWSAVVDPHVVIRVTPNHLDGGRALHGAPGSQRFLTLQIQNRGDGPIVGDSERYPVSVRVIWIDAEGHHRVDDRSRTAAPNLRRGASGVMRLPLFLPPQPGQHTARITLFQEQVAWFHDLDPASRLDLDVLVSP